MPLLPHRADYATKSLEAEDELVRALYAVAHALLRIADRIDRRPGEPTLEDELGPTTFRSQGRAPR
ncbi:MAG: hypothetical protein JO081_17910 [Alphaproteobacteria bacterium]|nr:hypothetical protein [Alphaproteobacteria bacterium]